MPQLPVFFCMKPGRSNITHQVTEFIPQKAHEEAQATRQLWTYPNHNSNSKSKIARPCTAFAPEAKPSAMLDFFKEESWKPLAEGMKHTWKNLVQKELRPHLKPPRKKMKTWEKKWFGIAKTAAGNRAQWRGVVRDISMTGNGER